MILSNWDGGNFDSLLLTLFFWFLLGRCRRNDGERERHAARASGHAGEEDLRPERRDRLPQVDAGRRPAAPQSDGGPPRYSDTALPHALPPALRSVAFHFATILLRQSPCLFGRKKKNVWVKRPPFGVTTQTWGTLGLISFAWAFPRPRLSIDAALPHALPPRLETSVAFHFAPILLRQSPCLFRGKKRLGQTTPFWGHDPHLGNPRFDIIGSRLFPDPMKKCKGAWQTTWGSWPTDRDPFSTGH